MLLNFRVSNYLSFNEEEEFSMLAGQVASLEQHVIKIGEGRNAPEVLRGAVLYGANASGKTNLIKAIQCFKQLVTSGLKKMPERPSHFRAEESSIDRVTKFEAEIKIGSKIYAYGVDIQLNTNKLKEEWLFEIKKTTDKPIFERKVLEDGASTVNRIALSGPALKKFKVYLDDINENELLLTTLSAKKGEGFEVFREVFHWFTHHLYVVFPNSRFLSFKEIMDDEEDYKLYLSLLRFFNTDILGLDIVEREQEQNLNESDLSLPKNNVYRINERLLHVSEEGKITVSKLLARYKPELSANIVDLDFEELSDGTKRILDIIPMLIQLYKRPVTVLIDEIDRSLHPELTRRLLEVFFSFADKQESQLMLTTHESSLLDLKILRRDEIWFVEKKPNGSSHLYSLEEFKPRFDLEIRKAYLQGRFGAIPFIADIDQLGWN